MKKVLIIFGTRPEAIKMAPVIKELERVNNCFRVLTCVTAQHRKMLDQVLSLFNIHPDFDLNLMERNQTLGNLTAKAVTSIVDVLSRITPDIVLVQGDTTTAMAAGLASFYQKIPVGHVEAGLRTSDRYNPFPEEINRRILGTLSSYHFCPTQRTVDALVREGFIKENIYLTGNTVIDALFMTLSKNGKVSSNISLNGKKVILVTAHRRENFGKPIENICAALKVIAGLHDDVQIFYPVHPNPNIYDPVYRILSDVKGIHLLDPLEYEQCVHLMKEAYIILTDSGGIQEEAPSLGIPVLVMRETTERPEAIEAGVGRLVGTQTLNIVSQVERLLSSKSEYREMARSINPYGDGRAAERIVKILKERLDA